MYQTRTTKIGFAAVAAFVLLNTSICSAVTSKVTTHQTIDDFIEGQTEHVVITSEGKIRLGPDFQILAEDIKDTWLINTIVTDKRGDLYLGTSPNGIIYKYSGNQLTEVYVSQPEKPAVQIDTNEPNETAAPDMTNMHIFAMAIDSRGRILAGVSGAKAKLLLINNGNTQTLFEPDANDVKYIHDIQLDNAGNIYLATGPEGMIYQIAPNMKTPRLIYDSKEKNILALAAADNGMIYAGTDGSGLIYKIEPASAKASAIYDSEQEEITDLYFAKDGNLYAIGTSANVAKNQQKQKRANGIPTAGRPEMPMGPAPINVNNDSDILQLRIANTAEDNNGQGNRKAQANRKGPAGPASELYKIDTQGFVTKPLSKVAVFFSMLKSEGQFLIGTGNEAELFTYNTETEEDYLLYQDKQASQIIALAKYGKNIYLGTANPAKLIRITPSYATEGTYESPLVDAGQPARWGKFQIAAKIPQDTYVQFQARTSNVADINHPAFSDWTAPQRIEQPAETDVPLGRYCQYKLILKTNRPSITPMVNKASIAYVVPNLAPDLEEIKTQTTEQTPQHILQISYQAKDENEDKLTYKIDFRRLGRNTWITLEEDYDKPSYNWDTRTVEDGRYEVRVTASDIQTNTPQTKLTDSRISDSFVIDNTAPEIGNVSVEIGPDTATLRFTVNDNFTAIGNVHYTVNSNEDFTRAIPKDMVYDTKSESFEIKLSELEKGDYVIALKLADDLGNERYHSLYLSISGK